MGMFDSVCFKCPDCGEAVEVQSEAGDCRLATFDPLRVPLGIASDIDGEDAWCPKCNKSYTVAMFPPIDVVWMKLVEWRDPDDDD